MQTRRKIFCYLPYASVGGSHRSLLGFLEGLGPEWEAVAAYGEENTAFLELYGSQGVRCEPIVVPGYTEIRRLGNPLRLLLSLLRVVRELRRLLRRERPTLLYSETMKGRLAAALAAWGLPVKVLGYVRDWRNVGPVNRLSFLLSDAFVVISRAVLERCFPEGRRRPDKTFLIYNGVDPERFIPGPPDEALRCGLGLEGCRVVVFCGRIVPWKRIDLALRAVAELRKRGLDDVKLLVVGELQENIHPGSSAEFAAVVDETGLAGRLVRTGFVPDVRPYLSLADVVAVPSDFEPFGRIVIESLALERPVVAAASGGIPEIITDGVDGLLIPPGDHPALADALERLLGSPQTARRLATAGRRMVLERFTMERNQRKLRALVRRLTD